MGKNKGKKVIQLPTSPENYIKTRARNLPVGKCYINEGWAESGFASIIVSRNHINGNFTFAVYLVDLYCLGVKDTFYESNVNTEFTELLDKFMRQQQVEEIDYALTHNIIYGAVEYAEDLGFKPHKGFEISQYVLEEDDDRVELIDIQFGLNGKPAILLGKEKHPANIITTLERTVGKGNFITMDESELADDDDGVQENVWKEDDDEELSVDDITDIIEGNKKTSPKKFAKIVFAVYTEQCTQQEAVEMFEIIDEVDAWKIVEEGETDEPFSLREERELIYDSLYETLEKNAASAIPEIEEQISNHPDEFLFYTLLTLAYKKINDIDKQNESIILTYQKFPHSIIAFTNYILIMTGKLNFDELEKIIGSKFDFHHFFPGRQKISFEELAALAGALFVYFSEVTRELHKAIAYAMILSSIIFYDESKEKADEILLSSVQVMLSETAKRNNFENENNENHLRIVE